VESVDVDLFCEFYFNNVLLAEPVVKKSLGSPDWHEGSIHGSTSVRKIGDRRWREKKLPKRSLLAPYTSR